MPSVTLFFSYGVSLKTWDESGFLSREYSYYKDLQEGGVDVQFITYGDKSDFEFSAALGGIKIIPIYDTMRKSKYKLFNLLNSLTIPFVFKRHLESSDILKTNQIWGSWVGVVAKLWYGKPLFIRAGYDLYMNALVGEKNRLKIWFIYAISKLAYKNADFIWLPTSEISEFVVSTHKIQHSRIVVFPNWIDTDLFYLGSFENTYSNKILYIGRLSPEKNISLLINALSETDIKIDIVGDGELRSELNSEAQRLGVEAQFLGRIPNYDLPELINKYPIVVLCSNFEGSPKTLLESMACGRAVVGTNKPGISNVITNNFDGVLCESEPEELKSALIDLMGNVVKRKRLGREARNKIVNKNSKSQAIKTELSVYRLILEKISSK